MKTVLLTGGIGSGKSAVCGLLAERGVPVYDCDRAAKDAYDAHPEIIGRLEAEFGLGLRLPGGRLDRSLLGSIIFSVPGALAKVEAEVHPAVLDDFLRWRESASAALEGGFHYAGLPPFVVMESAIALEKPLFAGVWDAVVLVTAPEQMCIERACRRDSASPDAIRARIRAQKFDPLRADAVINNDLDLETLRRRTDLAFSKLFA